jgi:hypothetical protein
MRKCDFCAQEIQDEAVYCRHCHRDLPRNERLAGKKRCAYCAEWIGAPSSARIARTIWSPAAV